MPDFQALLHSIAERPAIYVGNCSIRAVSHYLDGYCDALRDLGHAEKPLDGWMRWVELRFLISNPAWHWTRILLHVYGSDQAAIEALPELHREFLAERAMIGVDGIEALLDQRILEEHGEPWHEPPATNTTIDD
ncbi:hypothetical protein EP7_000175 [Isosphaeraceae bacterium EP7]